MPHGSNKQYEEPFPHVTNKGEERYIDEIQNNTLIGYKYFAFTGSVTLQLKVKTKGAGSVTISQNLEGEPLATIAIPKSEEWTLVTAKVPFAQGVTPLYLKYYGEEDMSLLEIAFL